MKSIGEVGKAVIQQGEQNTSFFSSPRLLYFVLGMFTYLIFAYYNALLTSLMTSGPPGIPIENLQVRHLIR